MHNFLLLSSQCVILSSPSPWSHQSVSPPFPNPPPSLPSVLDDLPSHSLTFSLRLIPLTMHVPKTDLIFIRGANPAPPTSSPPTQPHAPVPSLSGIASYPNPSHVPVQANLPNAPPRDTPMPPLPQQHTHTHMDDTPPLHILPYWNLEACVTGASTNPWLFVSIKPRARVCLFALSVSAALLNWRVPHF